MDASTRGEWDRRRAWPDRAIAAIAARQHTIIDRPQLLELGVHPRTIGAALTRGRIVRVHVGVYSLVPAAARPRWAGPQAALLACGPSAVLSHHAAARLHGLRVPRLRPGPAVASATGDRRVRLRGPPFGSAGA